MTSWRKKRKGNKRMNRQEMLEKDKPKQDVRREKAREWK